MIESRYWDRIEAGEGRSRKRISELMAMLHLENIARRVTCKFPQIRTYSRIAVVGGFILDALHYMTVLNLFIVIYNDIASNEVHQSPAVRRYLKCVWKARGQIF